MCDIHGHGGGDEILFRDFINSVREGRTNALTSAKNSVQSHMMAFASERSRIEGTVINFNEYVQQIKSYTNKKDV